VVTGLVALSVFAVFRFCFFPFCDEVGSSLMFDRFCGVGSFPSVFLFHILALPQCLRVGFGFGL